VSPHQNLRQPLERRASARNLLEITELKLKVQPLGIRKIEAGPISGRILFDDTPRIDPSQ
jgi:transcription-repair coupling factor (superfamily II helicase)